MPLTRPTHSGWWFFYNAACIYWRATVVDVPNGIVTGRWIAGTLRLEDLTGEWRKPLDSEVVIAQRDSLGRFVSFLGACDSSRWTLAPFQHSTQEGG